jgi:colanic acid/amylovoran biosynthesis glycosyltransferase
MRAAEHLCALAGDENVFETVVARCSAFLSSDLPLNVHFGISNLISDPLTVDAITVAGEDTRPPGLPWIFTMHSDDPDYWCVAEALTPETHGGSSVCVSQFLAHQLRQRLPATNPQVIPCGVTLPTAQASFADQPFRVVYSGRMVERQKCIHQVVHTLIHACRASSQIEANLIGDGPDRAACEQLVHQAGLAGRIHFHGRVPPKQVQPLLQRSQAILLMSDFEGLPVALLEAMAAGVVPVVRAIKSGIPELVLHEETGLLVQNDPAEAAAALVRLVREPELWLHCSSEARARVLNYYSAEHCFALWTRLIMDRNNTGCQFPINITNLSRSLPLNDQRWQNITRSTRKASDRLHPRRLLSVMKRRIGI